MAIRVPVDTPVRQWQSLVPRDEGPRTADRTPARRVPEEKKEGELVTLVGDPDALARQYEEFKRRFG